MSQQQNDSPGKTKQINRNGILLSRKHETIFFLSSRDIPKESTFAEDHFYSPSVPPNQSLSNVIELRCYIKSNERSIVSLYVVLIPTRGPILLQNRFLNASVGAQY